MLLWKRGFNSIEEKSHELVDCKVKGKNYRLLISEAAYSG
jgi:hypothetical protein